ncbi:MAG: hypothetical protein AAF713_19020 [Pseudomonadota bacterium]
MKDFGFQIGRLTVAVYGWEFDELTCKDDAQWLLISMKYRSAFNTVEVTGPFLRADELVR